MMHHTASLRTGELRPIRICDGSIELTAKNYHQRVQANNPGDSTPESSSGGVSPNKAAKALT